MLSEIDNGGLFRISGQIFVGYSNLPIKDLGESFAIRSNQNIYIIAIFIHHAKGWGLMHMGARNKPVWPARLVIQAE